MRWYCILCDYWGVRFMSFGRTGKVLAVNLTSKPNISKHRWSKTPSMQTLGFLFSVPDSLEPNDLENHNYSKNWDRVGDVLQVMVGRLAETEDDRLHCGEDHTAVVTAADGTAADSH